MKTNIYIYVFIYICLYIYKMFLYDIGKHLRIIKNHASKYITVRDHSRQNTKVQQRTYTNI